MSVSDPKYIRNSFLPKLLQVNAITIGPFIFIKEGVELTERLRKHEEEHVKQFFREPFTFWVKYLVFSAIHGYYNNPYEIAARKASL